VTDFIKEVDEDLRQDQYKKLWDKYGRYVLAAAVGLVLAVTGVVLWRDWQRDKRMAASAELSDAVTLIATDAKQATASLSAFAAKSGPGLATLARFQEAVAFLQQGNAEQAIRIYDGLAADGQVEPVFRELASLLAVQHQIDRDDAATLTSKLQPLTADGGVWRYQALELSAILAHRSGDRARTIELFRRLSDDAGAPASIRARAAEMLAALSG
jgi:hypothetical protein